MLIVFNPTAGSRRRSRLERAAAWLPGARLAETRGPGHAGHLARQAAAAGEDCVVAAGGDGTVAEVAAGLAGSATVLGILPLGTANVLSLELGLPRGPEAAAAVLRTGREAAFWPGIARFADGRQLLFVQMLGLGLDAEVVRRLDPRLKRAIGRAAYVWQTALTLPRYAFPPVTARLDGGAPLRASALVVSKGRLYAGPFPLAPEATPLRPGFHVALMTGRAGQAALAAALLPLGLLPRLPGLSLRRANHVTLEGAGVPAQTDGDFHGCLPVTVEDAPAPLRIRLPAMDEGDVSD
ncbi:diacylglycerol/lipid kinase family protein [Roseomonas marmotae]|uniref:Diacylglycerol kinase family lipid kinase n=1 Tax=Roseomonas marmotae TaxID=2768161 RepID=A0ABS3KJ41_9PROT|nr:diacylglycerol kinase family protein [Roseomonas marmotae]MBO1076985.1 diacylglycerol kinase family lipid kinase [Roseomonas marmotae]QTI79820.1 diacylglycerol kinase family lipid kinase [Roseomonas marmotae]